MSFRLLIGGLLSLICLHGCAHKPAQEKKYVTTVICIVNSINMQTSCGKAIIDMGSLKVLKPDEVVLMMNKGGELFISTYR